MAVFLVPEELLSNALYPKALLYDPVLFVNNAEVPTAVFSSPEILLSNALAPNALLKDPFVFEYPVYTQKQY